MLKIKYSCLHIVLKFVVLTFAVQSMNSTSNYSSTEYTTIGTGVYSSCSILRASVTDDSDE
jgi:hypothetical protein